MRDGVHGFMNGGMGVFENINAYVWNLGINHMSQNGILYVCTEVLIYRAFLAHFVHF